MPSIRSVLVTGGGGFVGSRMVAHLAGAGLAVGVLGRSAGDALPDGVRFHPADITEPLAAPAERYDAVVHLAGANDVDSRSPRTALLATTLGARHALDLAAAMQCRRFVYFSTFQVYGASAGAVSEATPPAPQNDYGITHLFAEEYAAMYGRRTGMGVACVRPTNIFGCPPSPGHDRWSLVPNCFCRDAIQEGAIVLKSSGRQYRDFVSLDAVAGFTRALLAADVPPAVVNLASGQCLTILEVARLVRDAHARLFGAPCGLEIQSDQPAAAAPLEVSLDVCGPYLPPEDVRAVMVREVEKTLLMLKEAAA